ncbi:uncharacterized protein LOC134181259 [Corticium candelabrum]|uniref:uncharacterized protein LOC134181259 n=1 Tax=Corticium candelabrum TaxID=121492 RepID=UPI002E268684|nr:uncharacterized protein LOC134181259 [Corticium candelabrum]
MVQLRKPMDIDVKKNISVAQQRQKAQYDARHRKGEYKVGDMVLLRNMKKLSRQGSKAAEAWSGPYKITEKAGNHTYYLKWSGDVKANKTLYSSTRLKPYNVRQQLGRRSVKTEDRHQDSSVDRPIPVLLQTSNATESLDKASPLPCGKDDHKAKAPKSYVKVTLGCNLQWSHPSEDLLDQERLQCCLASLGFRAYNVLGDGNCQFRAVAHQIYMAVRHTTLLSENKQLTL